MISFSLSQEVRDLNARPVSGISISPKEDNMMIWHGSIKASVCSPFYPFSLSDSPTEFSSAQADSPYRGGTFHFTIVFPDNFPFKPPTVTFLTKIYHPGFNEEGHICVPLLRDDWKPATSMGTGTAYRGAPPSRASPDVNSIKIVLSTIQNKLENPSPDDPFDADVAAVRIAWRTQMTGL